MNREVLSRVNWNNSYKLLSKGIGLPSNSNTQRMIKSKSFSIAAQSSNFCNFKKVVLKINSVQPQNLSNSIKNYHSTSTQRSSKHRKNNEYGDDHSGRSRAKILGLLMSAAAAYHILPDEKNGKLSKVLVSDKTTLEPGSITFTYDDRITLSLEECNLAYEQTMQILKFAMMKNGLPGLSIHVSIDGIPLISEGLGLSDIENGVKCGPQTVYRIASISKPISATIAMRLKEMGLLNLDAPITDYVPTWPSKHLEQHKVNITMRQLLSHTAGIRHYNLKKPSDKEKADKENLKQKMKEIKEPHYSNEYLREKHHNLNQIINKEGTTIKLNLLKKMMYYISEYSLEEFYINQPISDVSSAVKLFSDDDLFFKPGTDFKYSSHGYSLVSLIIEKIFKSSFSLLLPSLFREIRLRETYLDYHSTIIPNRARYYTEENGFLQNAPYVNNSYKWAGGGLLSTVRDLNKFGTAMLYSLQTTENDIKNNGMKPGILSSKSVKEMWSPFSFNKSARQDMRKGFFSGYGLGWFVRASTQSPTSPSLVSTDRLYVCHTGGAMGASSILAMTPNAKCTFRIKEAESIQEKLEGETFLKEGQNDKSEGLKYYKFVDIEEKKEDESNDGKGIVVSIITNKSNISLSSEAMQIIDIYADIMKKS